MDEEVFPVVDIKNIEFVAQLKTGTRLKGFSVKYEAVGTERHQDTCRKLMLSGSDIRRQIKNPDILFHVIFVAGEIGKTTGSNAKILHIGIVLGIEEDGG